MNNQSQRLAALSANNESIANISISSASLRDERLNMSEMEDDHTVKSNDSVSVSKNEEKISMVPLTEDFEPGEFDVICGRGKKCYAHSGNENFRKLVEAKLEPYQAAKSRPEKSEILSSIVDEVRKLSPEGGFVKQERSGRWFEVGDFLAREKTSQAFRDALFTQYRSSKKSKHEKRRMRSKMKTTLSSDKSPSKLPHRTASGQRLFQQLTTMREENHPPPRPRTYSLSATRGGQGRARGATPYRTASLSSPRSPFQSDRNAAPREAPYHRVHTAPARTHGIDSRRGRDQDEPLHQFEWEDAPRFHPLRPTDLPPLKLNNDLIMAEIECVPQPEPQSFHESWTSSASTEFERAPRRRGQQSFHESWTASASAKLDRVPRRRGQQSFHESWTASGTTDLDDMEHVPSRRQEPQAFHESWTTAGTAPSDADMMECESSSSTLATSRSAPIYATSNRNIAIVHPEKHGQHDEGMHQRSDSSHQASVIVAQLASVLPLTEDENPFEPIPLTDSQDMEDANEAFHSEW